MKNVIRFSVFETNSSSTHSVVVAPYNPPVDPITEEQAQKKFILDGSYPSVSFHWYHKACYLSMAVIYVRFKEDFYDYSKNKWIHLTDKQVKKERERRKDTLLRVLHKKYPKAEISFSFNLKSELYDDDYDDTIWQKFSVDDDTLYDFIFGDNAIYIEGD